jgi:hypothetical protein
MCSDAATYHIDWAFVTQLEVLVEYSIPETNLKRRAIYQNLLADI